MPVSPAPKPEPVIVMEVPGAALVRLVEIPAVVVNVISATLPTDVEAPYASMVWRPAVEAGTAKVAVQPPVGLAETDGGTVVTAMLSKVTAMPVSLAPKPVPVIVSEDPGAALAGLDDIFGVTLKAVVAVLVAPVAVMVREPEAEAGIT